MARETLRGFLQLGAFITVAGLCSAWFVPRDSGEFVISICGSVIGLTLLGGSIIVWRLLK